MEMDDAYANGPYVEGSETFPDRWAAAAAAFREKLQADGRAQVGVRYGESSRQVYDLFLPDGSPEGLCVFVHGGYWLKFDGSYWSHLAEGAVAKGWAVAIPTYDLCPDVRISDITGQIAQAIENASDKVDGPIVLAGHSAGGHLVSRMAVPGVLSEGVAARLMRVVPISPVSDLRPLLQTSMNADFKMDMAAAEAESPVLMEKMPVPVTVWVGADERPVFLDQARWLSEAWSADLRIAVAKNHFDVIEALSDPESDMIGDLIP